MLAARSRTSVVGDSGRRHAVADRCSLNRAVMCQRVRRLTLDGASRARTLPPNNPLMDAGRFTDRDRTRGHSPGGITRRLSRRLLTAGSGPCGGTGDIPRP
jgi:hypothetical protein